MMARARWRKGELQNHKDHWRDDCVDDVDDHGGGDDIEESEIVFLES
jgi:hypothetical protein